MSSSLPSTGAQYIHSYSYEINKQINKSQGPLSSKICLSKSQTEVVLCSGAFCFFTIHRRWYMRTLCCLFHHQVFKVLGESRCPKIGPDRRRRCGLVGVQQMIVSSMTGSMSGLTRSYQRGLKNRDLELELREVLLLREARSSRSSKWLSKMLVLGGLS